MKYNLNKLIISSISLIIVLLIISSCNKYKHRITPEDDKSMDDLNIPENFDFETSQGVTINFNDNLKVDDTARYKIYLHSTQTRVDTVIYLNDNGDEVTEYVNTPDPANSLIATKVSTNGIFTLLANIPSYIDELYVVKNVNGVFSSEILQISGNKASFGGSSKSLFDDPDDMLYGVNRSGDLFTINPLTGELVVIADLVSNSYTCAIDKINRVLYTIGTNKRLYKYDIDSETFTTVGNVRMSGDRLDYNEDDGLLYFSNRDKLYSIDPTNAKVLTSKKIKGLHDKKEGDLKYDDNGDLFMCSKSGLYKIIFNQEETSAVRISSSNLPFKPTSLAIDSNNDFWLATDDSDAKLVLMNHITGGWEYRFGEYDIKISDLTSIPVVSSGIPQTDTDGDGIIDFYDEFPLDANKAYSTYSPSIYDVGTLSFEDNWPEQGDYDFNDLVVNYQFITILNSSDEVVELHCNYTIKHIGASYINGFGFELPFSANLIESVTGYNITAGIVNIGGNGLEANQAKPVVIVCDDVNANAYQELKIVINFLNPVASDVVGTPPFNPFLFVDQNRGMEIHLANYPPTSLADYSYFGTQDDTSDSAVGRYYKTSNNLPWAMQISQEFKYPKETIPINHGYLKFNSWAQSGGGLYKDWYTDVSGYRDNSKLNIDGN
ncbi:MAG: LruC domain-containing protein, partial [Bacteroidota bacterium]